MLTRQGHEILIGSKKDPQFGSVIAFGMGGVATELFKDINIGFPPLNQVLAKRLMEKTEIFKYLSAKENNVNLRLLEETLVKFSQLVIDFPEIKEVDINPLIVIESGVVAVDSRITIDPNKILLYF